MRYVMAACVLVLAALLGHAQVVGEKNDKEKGEPTPPWAKVTLGGEIRDLLELRAKVDVLALLDREIPLVHLAKQWQGPPPQTAWGFADPNDKLIVTYHVRSMQVGDATWVVTLLDDFNNKDFNKLLPKLRATKSASVPTVFEGIIGATRDKDPFVAHANASGKMRLIGKDEKNAPGMGEITVEGQALPGKYEVAKGKYTSLAIQNGSSPILVTGKVAGIQGPKGTLFVTGKLLISRQGPLVVEAKRIGLEAPKVKQSGGKNPG